MAAAEGVVVSPVARDSRDIPSDMSLGDYLLTNLRANLPRLRNREWIIDVKTGTQIKFDQVEELSQKVASALTRLGFNKGDVLYFVTYEMALLFIVQLAVWRLGGITRGWYQCEPQDVYENQITETEAKFLLYDEDTAPMLNKALTNIKWPVQCFCFGKVEGARPIQQLLLDDGKAIPTNVSISPREDVVVIPSTSGSTGNPKGVLHTHFTAIASTNSVRAYFFRTSSIMSAMMNFSIGNFTLIIESLCAGGTIYHIPKLNKEDFFTLIAKYKPESVGMYPYFASWFARSSQLKEVDLSFLKMIGIGAASLDPGTVQLFNEILPHVSVEQGYGMTECMHITYTPLRKDYPNAPLIMFETKDEKIMSTGRLHPYVTAKIVHPKSGITLGRGERGEICVKTPSLMLGYKREGQHQPDRDDIDSDGWYHTGDLGFFDSDDNLFLLERINFVYKYKTVPIMPSEIESVLLKHAAVHGAGVVGVPNPETDNLTRAYVVVKAGHQVTASELEKHVQGHLTYYKWLHGGVRFIEALPQNRNGKLDRKALTNLALNEGKYKSN